MELRDEDVLGNEPAGDRRHAVGGAQQDPAAELLVLVGVGGLAALVVSALPQLAPLGTTAGPAPGPRSGR